MEMRGGTNDRGFCDKQGSEIENRKGKERCGCMKDHRINEPRV